MALHKTILITYAALAALAAAGEPVKKASIKSRAAFVYKDIHENAEVATLFRKGQVVLLLEKKSDTQDKLWYRAVCEGDTGWVESKDLQLGESASALDQEPAPTLSRRNKKERRQYVMEHPGIDRRVQKLIRDGHVGVGMKTEHVLASLGPPDFKKTVFLLDRGQLPVWIYNPENPTVIVFEKEEVKGWSQN